MYEFEPPDYARSDGMGDAYIGVLREVYRSLSHSSSTPHHLAHDPAAADARSSDGGRRSFGSETDSPSALPDLAKSRAEMMRRFNCRRRPI